MIRSDACCGGTQQIHGLTGRMSCSEPSMLGPDFTPKIMPQISCWNVLGLGPIKYEDIGDPNKQAPETD